MPQEDAASFDKTLELGKELARSLPDNDVLSRWMAHHVADLITRAESASGEAAQAIRRETATTILELWAQRASLGDHRPFTSFEPVFRALERLSAPQRPWHFYRLFNEDSAPDTDDLASVPLLDYALALEHVARRVVEETIRFAADEALSRETKWLKLAAHLPDEDDTRAARALLDLAQDEENETPPDTTPDAMSPDGPTNADHRLVAALHTAEDELREIRLALEEAFRQSVGTDE